MSRFLSGLLGHVFVFLVGLGAGLWLAGQAPPADAAAAPSALLRVVDGDSVVMPGVLGAEQDVRLLDIDAPERGQPFADRATAEVERLCLGADVSLDTRDGARATDGYGRLLAQLRCDGVHVNRHLVEQGLAWVSDRYNEDPELVVAEREAEAACRGLWRDPDAVPPWVHRGRVIDGERVRPRGLCRRTARAG